MTRNNGNPYHKITNETKYVKRADCTFESASAFIILTTFYLLFILLRKDFITFDITE